MRCGKGGEIDGLDLVEVVLRVEKADGVAIPMEIRMPVVALRIASSTIPSNQSSHRIPDHTQFLDRSPTLLDLLDLSLDLMHDALASKLDSIIRRVTRIGFCLKDL